MGNKIDAVESALNFIKENKVIRVCIGLHLHYDRDEEYDYTGMHSVVIGATIMKYDKYAGCERAHTYQYAVDLEGSDEDECREVHSEVFHIIKKEYPEAEKREFVHDEVYY